MYKRWNKPVKYDFLIPVLELVFGKITPDGALMDGLINTEELDSMLLKCHDYSHFSRRQRIQRAAVFDVKSQPI